MTNSFTIELGPWFKAAAHGDIAVIALAGIVVLWLLAQHLRIWSVGGGNKKNNSSDSGVSRDDSTR
jgi:hypothetical protein